MLHLSNIASIAYYDYANKQLKYARGVKIPWNPNPDTPPYYSFTTSVLDTVGGTNFDCSLASDGTTLYIVYYDSAQRWSAEAGQVADGGVTWWAEARSTVCPYRTAGALC